MADKKDKHPGGRPLKFKSAKELQKKIDEYFESCYEEQFQPMLNKQGAICGWEPVLDKDGNVLKKQIKPFTVTGLALFLETSRETLVNYENNEEFFDTIRKAKLKCENYAEESLWQPKIATGIMFNLSNNYGWKAKQEVEQKVESHNINENYDYTDLAKQFYAKATPEEAKRRDDGDMTDREIRAIVERK